MEKGIWSEMHKLDFTNKLTKLCRILNNGIYARVKTGKHLYVYVYIGFKTFFYVVRHLDSIASYLPSKHLYSECKVNKGWREGDAIAPLLLRSKVETWGTISDLCFKLWHMLMMWLLWEEDYKLLKKYLHNW